ncbi:MAG: hypothetical protein DWQ36_10465 [Acidobacteria bacterium]|nr:MAG: hypothetical protein DWQ30_23130 [Acidobacteriota bacterium]REK07923.1 MAG: hypothetical protein DWQ36_10465 [Acidobacteriota bacterium]
MARRLVRERRFEIAVQPLRRLAGSAAPREADPELLALLAATEWELGELARAEATFRRAVAAAEDRGERRLAAAYRRQLGGLLSFAGRWPAAVEALEGLLSEEEGESDPGLLLEAARAWEGVAIGASEAGEVDAALGRARSLFEAAAAALPQNAEVHYGRARVLRRLGDEEGARSALRLYQRLYAEDQERIRATGRYAALMAAVRADLDAGRSSQALDRLRAMPQRLETLELHADVARSMGLREEAASALQRAVLLAPQRTDLMIQLNELLFEDSGGGE